MAEPVSKRVMRRMLQGAVVLFLQAVATLALAESLPDPTRPPAALNAAPDSAAGKTGPVLQSVLISPGRKVAIISGQTLQVGEKIGDQRVTKIAENEVILNGSGGMQTLKLFPEVEKRTVPHNANAKAKRSRQ